jgi:hypothetical protein
MAGLGYKLPGTTIEEVTQPSSVNISSSQRTPCFIGTASDYIFIKQEEVIISSTGTNVLDYSSCGLYEVSAAGTQKGLSDIVEGTAFDIVANNIVWTSAGLINLGIGRGATTYFSYYYDRLYDATYLTDVSLNDYRYKEWTKFEDVVADLGENIPAYPLVMIAYLCLKVYNVPKIATVQVRTGTVADYTDAIELIKYRDVQTICPLTTNSAVRTAYKTHVTERSLPDNGRYRVLWTGAVTGTPVGDESDPTSLRGMAKLMASELVIFVNATRAKYYYNDPTTREQLTTVVDGAFIAAAIAGYRDAFNYPSTTLLNRTVAGLELYDDDYDDYYSEYQLTLCGGSSLFIMQSLAGTIKVIDDLTTDNSTVETNNINIIYAKHYIAKDVAIQLNRTFVGKLILDTGAFANTVHAYLKLMFTIYKQAGIIESLGTITVTPKPNRRDTFLVFYSYTGTYTAKYFEGTYTLLV